MQGYQRIVEMLRIAGTDHRLFPATLLYNEGWLLRLVLDWFANNSSGEHPLRFAPGARWFSEALLPSQFFAVDRRDKLAEGWTHADGVIGHVSIGSAALADTKLNSGATQLVVTEAKLFSPLSTRVTNAAYYDQAARNVACIAEVLCRAERRPQDMKSLAFFVIAPESQISLGLFRSEMTKESIAGKVARRVAEYEPMRRSAKEQWLRTWFLPTLDSIEVNCLSWEAILEHLWKIAGYDVIDLKTFYSECLNFNKIQERD
jgi:hypothetical protein